MLRFLKDFAYLIAAWILLLLPTRRQVRKPPYLVLYALAGILALVVFITGVRAWTSRASRPRDLIRGVGGVVSFEGGPVAGALVTFHPRSLAGKAAFGITDGGGQFELALMTSEGWRGAMPGDYDVTVTKIVSHDTSSPEEWEESGKPAYRPDAVRYEAGAAPRGMNLLPQKYASPETSGLSAELHPSGERHFEFSLQPEEETKKTDGSTSRATRGLPHRGQTQRLQRPEWPPRGSVGTRPLDAHEGIRLRGGNDIEAKTSGDWRFVRRVQPLREVFECGVDAAAR